MHSIPSVGSVKRPAFLASKWNCGLSRLYSKKKRHYPHHVHVLAASSGEGWGQAAKLIAPSAPPSGAVVKYRLRREVPTVDATYPDRQIVVGYSSLISRHSSGKSGLSGSNMDYTPRYLPMYTCYIRCNTLYIHSAAISEFATTRLQV